MSRWWRARDDAVDNAKLILLSDKQHRAWFNLCCICSQNGGTLPEIAVIAVKLRTTPSKARAVIDELTALRLIDAGENGLTMHDWSRHQYKTDVTDPTNAERQSRYRKRHADPLRNDESNACKTVTVKRPDTEQRQIPEAKASGPRQQGTRLPPEWWPSAANVEYAASKGLSTNKINTEAEKFRNHWTAKTGKDATKLDWDATWQNWILRAMEINGHGRKQSLVERGHALADEARQLELAAGVGQPDDSLGSD